MRVVIAGSSGLIGTALVSSLRSDNHDVVRLVRRSTAGPDESRWDPDHDRLDLSVLQGADAVVNLCGVGIGDKRWSGSYKQAIRDSRIVATDVLAEAVASQKVPVLANASAVGYYGDTGDNIVDEDSPAGTDFLATTCRDWELATEPARKAGARVVNLRSGVVISPHGGMLGRFDASIRSVSADDWATVASTFRGSHSRTSATRSSSRSRIPNSPVPST
ncbi:hypothetical protein GCM10020255_089130 [Rhodococcus baikonurensis]